MNEAHLYGAKQIYPKFDNALQFRLSGIKEIEDFLIAEIIEGKNMSIVSKNIS